MIDLQVSVQTSKMLRVLENDTPTPIMVESDSSSGSDLPPICKKYRLTWWVVGAVLALLVVLGWVFIIVMLILEEKWQLVLVAWLLLYSAAHFCYWYFKRWRPRPDTVSVIVCDGLRGSFYVWEWECYRFLPTIPL